MKKFIFLSIVAFILLIGLTTVGLLISIDDNEGDANADSGGSYSFIGVSEEVLTYMPTVEMYCNEYKISDYVMYILAIMQVESGGKGFDVMQCSESLGLPLNSLDPEASIKQGCYYFSRLLASANTYGCDIFTVVQSYNYGDSFIPYVAKNGKNYTFALAMDFAKAKSGGAVLTYTNAVAVSVNGGWRYGYGNMFYVKLVSQYLGSSSGFIWPSDSCYIVTSVFGNRVHPISGEVRNHSGIDIGAAYGTNVLASASGKVVLSEYSGGYGNCIMIDHGNGYLTLYGHMSKLNVGVGSTVVQGQAIGLVGSTGNSTGPHIHFEVLLNGNRVDPLGYFSESLYAYG